MNKTPNFLSKQFATMLTVFAMALLTMSTGCSNAKDDPCEGITCNNGGTCVNGLCDCPAGFEGAGCDIEIVPDEVLISRITYTKFPAFKGNGDPWDNAPFPDSNPGLYVIVYRDADLGASSEDWVEVWNSYTEDGFIVNADPTVQQVFLPADNIWLNSPDQHYRISLYDYDGDGHGLPDDLLGGITFVPDPTGQGHPASIVQENSSVRFVLNAIYHF